MDFRTVSAKLSVDEYTKVKSYCREQKSSVSAFARRVLLDEIEPFVQSFSAGKNVFDYDRRRDCFVWRVELDKGEVVTVLNNVPPEYAKDLASALSSVLSFRDELQVKKRTASVAVPRKIIKRKTK